MKKLLPVVLLLTACEGSPPEIASAPFLPDSGNLFVRCGALIDGISDEVFHDRMVVIRDGRIEMIVDGDAEIRPGMSLLDLSDKTCLPGLINTHVHLASKPEDFVDYSIYYTDTPRIISGRRSVFQPPRFCQDLPRSATQASSFQMRVSYAKDQVDAGAAVGPRIRNGGPYMTIPRGGGTLWVPVPGGSEYSPSERDGHGQRRGRVSATR